jgi:hypothetical protein
MGLLGGWVILHIAQGGDMDLGSRLDIFHLLEGFLSYVTLLL